MIKVLMVIFIILAALFLIGGGYFLGVSFPMGQNPAPSPLTQSSLVPSSTPEPSASPSPSSSPTIGMSDKTSPGGPQLGDELGPNDAQRAIEKAIDSGNFNKVEPNLADKVALIIYASSCCAATSDPEEIINFISGKAESGKAPWVFNPDDVKYSELAESSDFFAVDKDGKALAFKLDGNNKLNSITFYADYRLAAN